MEELHKPSLIDRGGPIALTIVQKPEFELKYHMEAKFWFYRFKTHSIHTWEEMVSKFLSKYYPYLKALQLRKDILNFWQLPAESWDTEVYYDTTTGVSAHYSNTTSLLSAKIEVLGKQITYISQNLHHKPGPGHPHTIYYLDTDESDEDEPSKVEKSKINPLIREPSGALLMGKKISNSILLRILMTQF
nr:hypothetical protein [Tanacetum cinerariifolium]